MGSKRITPVNEQRHSSGKQNQRDHIKKRGNWCFHRGDRCYAFFVSVTTSEIAVIVVVQSSQWIKGFASFGSLGRGRFSIGWLPVGSNSIQPIPGKYTSG